MRHLQVLEDGLELLLGVHGGACALLVVVKLVKDRLVHEIEEDR
jgi:hypothetical protein